MARCASGIQDRFLVRRRHHRRPSSVANRSSTLQQDRRDPTVSQVASENSALPPDSSLQKSKGKKEKESVSLLPSGCRNPPPSLASTSSAEWLPNSRAAISDWSKYGDERVGEGVSSKIYHPILTVTFAPNFSFDYSVQNHSSAQFYFSFPVNS